MLEDLAGQQLLLASVQIYYAHPPPKNLLWASMLTGYLFPIMYHSLLEYNTLDLCLYKYDLL